MRALRVVLVVLSTVFSLLPSPSRSMASEPGMSGTLIGRVLYGGEPPEPQQLQIPLRLRVRRDGIEFDTEELPERRRLMEQGIPDETLIVGEDRGMANVVVWLRSKNVPMPQRPLRQPPPVTLRAVQGRFVPHVLVYWNVSAIRLVNDMGVATNFNVQTASVNRVVRDGQSFEIQQKWPSRGAAPQVVVSNIHPWLKAYEMPLNHPYFAVTDDSGRFKLEGLPLGNWEFAIWHETRGFLATDEYPQGRFNLEIGPGNTDLGDLTVDPKSIQRRALAAQLFRADAEPKVAERRVNAVSELHSAVMAGDLKRVKELLSVGINVNDRELRLNCTPLHLAARHGHIEIARALIDKGANVDARDINNCTPLMWAAKGGHAEVVRALLDAKAKIDASDSRNWTALHFAYERGHAAAAQLLIDHGASVKSETRDGETPRDLKPATQARVPLDARRNQGGTP